MCLTQSVPRLTTPAPCGSSWASPRKVDSGVGRGWHGRDAQEPLDKETSGGEFQALFLLPAPPNPWDLFSSFMNQVKAHNSQADNEDNIHVGKNNSLAPFA